MSLVCKIKYLCCEEFPECDSEVGVTDADPHLSVHSSEGPESLRHPAILHRLEADASQRRYRWVQAFLNQLVNEIYHFNSKE